MPAFPPCEGAPPCPLLGGLSQLGADRENARVSARAPVPLTPDHLDVLLFAISKADCEADPALGAVARFSISEFTAALGWSDSQAGYARAAQAIVELRQTEVEIACNDTITQFMLLGEFQRPNPGQADKKWSLALAAPLFRLARAARAPLADLHARAALRAPFSRWLHGFLSAQAAGPRHAYYAVGLCKAGGLQNARTANLLQQLRAALECLEAGQVERAGKTHRFTPVVAPGWDLTQNPAGEWILSVERA